jgi:hypothetical protein
MRKFFIALIVCILLTLFVYNFYSVLREKVSKADLKGFAEEKIGQLFNARIRVGDIKVGLLKYISLSGLEINQEMKDTFFYLVDVKRIVFRYNLWAFFKANISQPNRILLDTPSIEFTRFKIPHQLFQRSFFSKKSNILVDLKNGAVSYILPNVKTQFILEKISGHIAPASDGVFSVHFSAFGGGDLSGELALSGICNRSDGSYDLNVVMKDGAVRSLSFFPIENLKGTLRIADNTIHIEDISFTMRDIPVRVMGTIANFEDEPILNLNFAIETAHYVAGFTIFGTTDNLKIKGNSVIADVYHYLYAGDIILSEGGFLLRNLVINDHYTATGDFSFLEGTYTLIVRRKDQDLRLHFVHDDYTLKIEFALNHISFLNYDFVTVGTLTLTPALQFWTDKKFIMNAVVETDYMIFNYTPLNDFKGTFTLTPHTMEKMKLQWGNVYELTGNINLDEPRSVDIVLTIAGLNVSNYENFGGIELAKNLEAVIEGRTTFIGPLSNPQIEGYIRSSAGKYKVFDFDKALISFYGDRYILEFKDSKLFRNDKTFHVKGKIDFRQPNIFHDVYMESSERIILWRGWDLSKQVGDSTINVKRQIADGVDLSLHGKYRSSASDESRVHQGASLDYRYEDDQTISLSFEDADSDEMVALIHRIKF